MSDRASSYRFTGVFLIVWTGQAVSVVGSRLAGFGAILWVFDQTSSASLLSLLVATFSVPAVVVGPWAGAIADRFDRRTVMLIADGGAAITTIAGASLFFSNMLAVWHVIVWIGLASVAQAFHRPAFEAALPTLVGSEALPRANGLIQVGVSVGTVTGPALAALVLDQLGFGAIMLLDLATFMVAVATLLIVEFPAPEHDPERAQTRGVLQGWRYLSSQRGLVVLLVLFAVINIGLSVGNVLLVPLATSIADLTSAGIVGAVGGAGMVIASALVARFGLPRRMVRGILAAAAISGAGFALMGARASLPLLTSAHFIAMAMIPFAVAASSLVFQRVVPAGMLGRVFAFRSTVALAVMPVATLAAGPLADRWAEPLMAGFGPLAILLQGLLGTGAGRGYALMFVLAGALILTTALVGTRLRSLKELEAQATESPREGTPATAA